MNSNAESRNVTWTTMQPDDLLIEPYPNSLNVTFKIGAKVWQQQLHYVKMSSHGHTLNVSVCYHLSHLKKVMHKPNSLNGTHLYNSQLDLKHKQRCIML